MLGISKPVFNQLLYGHQQGLSFKTVSAVCDKLGVSVDDFMADTSYARSARKGHRGA